MPYRLQNSRLYVPPTGGPSPVGMTVGNQIMVAMFPIVGLLQAILTVRPLILTDEEWNSLSSHQDAFTYEPPPATVTNVAQSGRALGLDERNALAAALNANSRRAAQVANALLGEQALGRPRLRTESEVRNQGRSNQGDTEPEDL